MLPLNSNLIRTQNKNTNFNEDRICIFIELGN